MKRAWELILVLLFVLVKGYAQVELGDSAAVTPHSPNDFLLLAQNSKGNFEQQFVHAQRAAELFWAEKNKEKYLEAQLLLLQAAHYKQDSLIFAQEIEKVFTVANSLEDTSSLVKAYFFLGKFYFAEGEFKKGMVAFKWPDRLGLYNRESLDDNVSILGALVDLHLSYFSDIEAVFTYLVRLQQLADTYEAPSAYVVSNMKKGYLFARAYNFEQSNNFMRNAYPYLDDIENNGYLVYFYRRLIRNFIENDEPDSAAYYLKQFGERVTYEPGDPRAHYMKAMEARIEAEMGETAVLDDEFMASYEYFGKRNQANQKRGVNEELAIYTKALVHINRREWAKAEAEIEKLFEAFDLNNDPMYRMGGYELLYRALAAQGRTEEALKAHIKFKQATDSVNQFAFKQGEELMKMHLALKSSEKENIQAQQLITHKNNSLWLTALGLGLMVGIALVLWQLSQQRKRQKEKLSALVAEKTAELVHTNQQLSLNNTELERFTFMAYHDLQEPIRTIMGFADMLERKVPQDKNEHNHQYIHYIQKAGLQMQGLIRDILAYSDFAKSQEQLLPLDLNEVVKEALFSLQDVIQAKGAVVEYGNLPSILANRSQCVIVFKNLILNGITYNQSKPPKVVISYEALPGKHQFTIEDNGIGIAPEHHETIFEHFKRLHNRSVYEGTGMGLAIVKKLVTQKGGEISLKSELGAGTRMIITLPQGPAMKSEIMYEAPKKVLIQ